MATKKCPYYGWVGNLKDFEIDHSFPLSKGGSSLFLNLQWICSGCNRQKGTMTHEQYLAWRITNLYKANYGLMKVG